MLHGTQLLCWAVEVDGRVLEGVWQWGRGGVEGGGGRGRAEGREGESI